MRKMITIIKEVWEEFYGKMQVLRRFHVSSLELIKSEAGDATIFSL